MAQEVYEEWSFAPKSANKNAVLCHSPFCSNDQGVE